MANYIIAETISVDEYLASLPVERQETVSVLRNIIVENLPPGYLETMNMGVIAYEIPLADYPGTYNGSPLTYLALADRKNYISLHVTCFYHSEKQEKMLRDGFKKANKRLDMGKSCIRFRHLDDIPLGVIAEVVASIPADVMIAEYEESRRK